MLLQIYIQQINVAVHHELETPYGIWKAFLPTTDNNGIDMKTHSHGINIGLNWNKELFLQIYGFLFRKKSSFAPTFLLPKSNDRQRLLSKKGLLKVYGIFIIYKCKTKLDLDFSNEHKSYEKRLLCAPEMTNCCSIKWYGLNFSSNSRRDAKPTMHIWKCHLQ